MSFVALLACTVSSCLAVVQPATANLTAERVISADAINAATLSDVPLDYVPFAKCVDPVTTGSTFAPTNNVQPEGLVLPEQTAELPSGVIARLQVLLDRAGASPGVIDGFDGENVRNAVAAFQVMHGLSVDGRLGDEVIAELEVPGDVLGAYVITADDLSVVVPALPKDYAEQAKMSFLGYTSVSEGLAEQFHMDVDLLKAINPDTAFELGETIYVPELGSNRSGKVASIEVDKAKGQLRAYDGAGQLLAAYPATIGSEENPSPSGMHRVQAVVEGPTYTYNPKVNFQQGGNVEVLTLPPGPNGPVGSVWIDLSEPTFGIHGTPEPSRIAKTGSHGCVGLTNWDAQELAKLVRKGV